ncbi:unnamed protein product [Ostreobium quekettii]|uniref:Uncharacterized protein n=1 Tax=Ostreobium quekettii TaxID=121088 RepID=A0A8S1IZK5_9CHLO|nr:unnamed protein product [Ostreobium quekettii]|eukprot:evm.model.scf_103EXC.3 EVM.evm.TU.scf_103EXC.3   scf_103EXC:48897-50359(-)
MTSRRTHTLPVSLTKAYGVIKAKICVMCGEDRCRFRMSAKPSVGKLPDTFEAITSDVVLRDVGQVLSLGVLRVLRKPMKKFTLAGVDDECLKALQAACGDRHVTFDDVMAFMEDRNHEVALADVEERGGWAKGTLYFKNCRRGGWHGPPGLEPTDAVIRSPRFWLESFRSRKKSGRVKGMRSGSMGSGALSEGAWAPRDGVATC